MRTTYIIYILICFSFFTACKKQKDNVYLANEGTSGFEGYGFKANFNLLTHTVREDSLKTDSLSHYLVGVITHPVFGNYRTTSFLQYNLPQLDKVISTQTLDSVVLFMNYTSSSAYYGDLNSIINFNVHEVTQAMDFSNTHSSSSYTFNNTPIGAFSGKFKLTDSITINELGINTRVAPTIRIKLSATFANKLFNASAADLSSQANFIAFFRGLALVPSNLPTTGSGAIAAFNFKSSLSKIRMYYNGNMQSDFVCTETTRKLTNYEVKNQALEIAKQKSIANFSFDTGYAQSLSGAKLKVEIKNLFDIINSGKSISISKAELIIRPVAGSFNSPFGLPSRLLVLQPNAKNNLNSGILDLLEPFYGGFYNSAEGYYKFNITRHIQSLFIDKQQKNIDNNKGLFIVVPTDNPVAPSQIIIDTRKNIANAGIEFKIFYTEL